MPRIVIKDGIKTEEELDKYLSMFKSKLRKEGFYTEMLKRRCYTKKSILKHNLESKRKHDKMLGR